MLENNGIQHPIVAQFQKKDIGCYFLTPIESNSVDLKHLRIYKQKNGFGTKLLKIICKEADIHEITLYVMPQSDENNGPISLEKLKIWYRKFGFKSIGEFMMERRVIID